MGQKNSKAEETIVGKEDPTVAHPHKRKKGKRYHSNRIDLNSISALESCRNIDTVLSEMGVKSIIDASSDSGMLMFYLFIYRR